MCTACRTNLYAVVQLMPNLGRGTRTYYTLHYACKYGEIMAIDANNQLQTVCRGAGWCVHELGWAVGLYA